MLQRHQILNIIAIGCFKTEKPPFHNQERRLLFHLQWMKYYFTVRLSIQMLHYRHLSRS
jgi:hypothetical protein